eukprot:CAMPEP_0172170918 /NCGR_PEP_ID=MMETSP1050-20130122/11593_1 /TAXON_ID=233186 /ORGANISM="Cryptomonas curvata, Strain CCAP979/52" /LENGTH=156 /DNA_ID=CAMNT_0012842271 /DNA_START=66 /DNA_END=536 /DNA_ORIENTATION=-
MKLSLLLVPFMFASVLSVLPPGYEDEMFCPPDSCLRSKIVRPGLTGPRTMFYECFNAVTGETGRPRAWGEKVGPEYKAELLTAGWHSQVCPGEDDENEENAEVRDQEKGILHQDKGRDCRKRNVDIRMLGARTCTFRSSPPSAACIGEFKSILRDV